MKNVKVYRTNNGCFGGYSDSYQNLTGDRMVTLTKHPLNSTDRRWSLAYWSRDGEKHGAFEHYRNKKEAVSEIKLFLTP